MKTQERPQHTTEELADAILEAEPEVETQSPSENRLRIARAKSVPNSNRPTQHRDK